MQTKPLSFQILSKNCIFWDYYLWCHAAAAAPVAFQSCKLISNKISWIQVSKVCKVILKTFNSNSFCFRVIKCVKCTTSIHKFQTSSIVWTMYFGHVEIARDYSLSSCQCTSLVNWHDSMVDVRWPPSGTYWHNRAVYSRQVGSTLCQIKL